MKILTIAEVAEMLGVSDEHVRGLIDDGELPSFSISRGKRKHSRILAEDVTAFVRRRKAKEKQPEPVLKPVGRLERAGGSW